MTEATRTILRAALAADPTIPADERDGWERAMREGIGATRTPAVPSEYMTRTEIAKRLGVCKGYVGELVRKGLVIRVPGMRRYIMKHA